MTRYRAADHIPAASWTGPGVGTGFAVDDHGNVTAQYRVQNQSPNSYVAHASLPAVLDGDTLVITASPGVVVADELPPTPEQLDRLRREKQQESWDREAEAWREKAASARAEIERNPGTDYHVDQIVLARVLTRFAAGEPLSEREREWLTRYQQHSNNESRTRELFK